MTRLKADDLSILSEEQLRNLVMEKQRVLDAVSKENQDLNFAAKGLTQKLQASEAGNEKLTKKMKVMQKDIDELALTVTRAFQLAALFLEKFMFLSDMPIAKAKDAKTLATYYQRCVQQVTLVTSWTEGVDHTQKLFELAERNVLGTKGRKKPVDPQEFISRSITKKNGKKNGTQDSHQG